MNNYITALLTLMLAIWGSTAPAQSWCPPGAEWTQAYSSVDWGSGYSTEGFVISRYVGDTMVGGYVAQHIQRDLYWREVGSSGYAQDNYGPKYTRQEDGVVFVWNGQDMFDTLLWFGAGPGDHWFLPNGGNAFQFLVSDTSTVIVEGLPLRRLTVSIVQVDPPQVLATDTLYERIGLVQGDCFDPVVIAADGISTGFLCYGDETISFVKPGVQECGFTVNVEVTALGQDALIWPNPGSTEIHISGKWTGSSEVRVLDGTGRVVLSASSPGGPLHLHSDKLAPGLYLVEVKSGQARRTVQWVKQ